MRIVNRATFLAMPENTLFSKYEPCIFRDLLIKGESLHCNDFCVSQIADAIDCDGSESFIDACDGAVQTGASLKMDFDLFGRDGCFNDNQLFAVWEKDDIEALIDKLNMCVKIEESEGKQ